MHRCPDLLIQAFLCQDASVELPLMPAESPWTVGVSDRAEHSGRCTGANAEFSRRSSIGAIVFALDS